MAEEQEDTQVPILSRLRPPAGAVRGKKRKGRGPGSGHGKTAGKGMKGQKARNPGNFGKLHFEGGQTPLQRRLPKLGFHNKFSKNIVTVNVVELNQFDDGATVDPETLVGAGLIRKTYDGVKVLGDGELEKKLTVKVHAFSKSAREKIEKAGGSAEAITKTVKA